MNISNYASCFHDGSLIDVQCEDNLIIISMESAEISPDENIDNIVLSKKFTIKGKLHLECINSIAESESLKLNKLEMLYDSAEVLHFKIKDKTIILDLLWVNFPPHPEITVYSFYAINAEKIWWENIPDLFDPFW